jgi:plasmid stabilization system protein ParE
MAAKKRRLRVELSPAAVSSLEEIGEWNARAYGLDHARRYIAFVIDQTEKLRTLHFAGKPVPTRPNLAYVIIRRNRKGHGHVAVYQVLGDLVMVLNYYHTAQDWQARLKASGLSL